MELLNDLEWSKYVFRELSIIPKNNQETDMVLEQNHEQQERIMSIVSSLNGKDTIKRYEINIKSMT